MKRYLFMALAFVLVVLTGVFAVRNTERASVDFGMTSVEAPMVVLLAGALVVGVLLALLCMIPGRWRARAERRRLARELRDVRDECDRLRRAPLKDHR